MSVCQIPQFDLFPRPGPAGAYRPADRQLGLLSCFLRDGWILSWNEYNIYILDYLNEVLQFHLDDCRYLGFAPLFRCVNVDIVVV